MANIINSVTPADTYSEIVTNNVVGNKKYIFECVTECPSGRFKTKIKNFASYFMKDLEYCMDCSLANCEVCYFP